MIFLQFFLCNYYPHHFLLNFISNQSIDIRILVMFLLAEPHFGATWPFFLNVKNLLIESAKKRVAKLSCVAQTAEERI